MGVKEDLESLKEGLSTSVTQQQQQQLQDAGYTTKDLLASAQFDDLVADPPKLPRAVARLISQASKKGQGTQQSQPSTPPRPAGWDITFDGIVRRLSKYLGNVDLRIVRAMNELYGAQFLAADDTQLTAWYKATLVRPQFSTLVNLRNTYGLVFDSPHHANPTRGAILYAFKEDNGEAVLVKFAQEPGGADREYAALRKMDGVKGTPAEKPWDVVFIEGCSDKSGAGLYIPECRAK